MAGEATLASVSPAGRGLVAGGLLALFAIGALWSARAHAPTYDEPLMLLAGYALNASGEHRWENNAHPPLGLRLSGLPLLPLSLRVPAALPPAWKERYILADLFLNDNVRSPDTLLFLGRMPSVLLGLVLGLVVYAWASRLGGAAAGLLALGLYATCGPVIDSAGLATNDMAVSCAMVASLYLLMRLLEAPAPWPARQPTWRMAGGLGLCLGAAVASKHTGLFMVGLLPVVIVSWMAGRSPSLARIGQALGRIAAALTVAAAVLLLVYAGHPDRYLESLRGQAMLSSNDHPTFLLGRLTWTGSPWYYLVALGAKLSLPLLALGVLGFLRRESGGGLSLDRLWLAGFAILMLWAVSFSRWFGLRYVLAVVPVLCVLAGRFVAGPASSPTTGWTVRMIVGLVLFLWQGVATWRVAPHFHAYFNEAAGGPAGGYRVLADSDLDWGQDLKPFAAWYRTFASARGPCELVLSYFGTGDPRRYRLGPFQELSPVGPVRRSRHVNSARPSREILAVSATNLQGLYYKPTDSVFDWLRRETPVAIIGHTIFVYDITGRRDVHEQMAGMYRTLGWIPEYRRERALSRGG